MRILNKRVDGVPPGAVYVGRPSKWGNPFVIGKDGDRETVISKYEKYLHARPDLMEAARRELRGKDLVCWCAPEACHAEVLLLIANVDVVDLWLDHGMTAEDYRHDDRMAGVMPWE